MANFAVLVDPLTDTAEATTRRESNAAPPSGLVDRVVSKVSEALTRLHHSRDTLISNSLVGGSTIRTDQVLGESKIDG